MTRNEENRLIAEKCEGMANFIVGSVFGNLYHRKEDDPASPLIEVDNYFTDIAACVRAAEAWRRQMAHKGERYWIFESGLVPEDRPSVRLYWDSGKSMQMSFGDTLEEAMASALVEAVK